MLSLSILSSLSSSYVYFVVWRLGLVRGFLTAAIANKKKKPCHNAPFKNAGRSVFSEMFIANGLTRTFRKPEKACDERRRGLM
jgi:hypothetical protein